MTAVLVILSVLLGTGGLSWLVAAVRVNTQNRLDASKAKAEEAKADDVIVHSAREMVAELRAEMDRKVTDLTAEVGRIRGHLEAAVTERDHLREVERTLRIENASLRARIDALEDRIDLLIAAASHPGPAGPTGIAGAAGVDGLAGATGTAGVAGTDGAPGATGATGTDGVAGATGARGATGETGPIGPTGSPGSSLP